MLKSTKKKLLYLIVLLFLTSCNPKNGFDVDLNKIDPVSVNIKRYEKALFSIPPDSLSNGLKNLHKDYSFFVGTEIDTLSLLSLYNYLNDPALIKAYDDILKMYPDLTFLESELSSAFRHIKYYIPDFQIPQIYSFISGFDFEQPVRYLDTVMVIGLDMYLGKGYYIYPLIGLPEYKSYKMRKESITVDCMQSIARSKIYYNPVTFNFLERMIYEGKVLYFCDITMPIVPDSLKIGFTNAQNEWCLTNEKSIWGFFMEQNFLYDTDRKVISQFMDDGPYTQSFASESPARTGAYIGWQIVRSYMERNEISIEELFKNTDAQEILKKSKYKPRS